MAYTAVLCGLILGLGLLGTIIWLCRAMARETARQGDLILALAAKRPFVVLEWTRAGHQVVAELNNQPVPVGGRHPVDRPDEVYEPDLDNEAVEIGERVPTA